MAGGAVQFLAAIGAPGLACRIGAAFRGAEIPPHQPNSGESAVMQMTR
jgi:hypothetical protein